MPGRVAQADFVPVFHILVVAVGIGGEFAGVLQFQGGHAQPLADEGVGDEGIDFAGIGGADAVGFFQGIHGFGVEVELVVHAALHLQGHGHSQGLLILSGGLKHVCGGLLCLFALPGGEEGVDIYPVGMEVIVELAGASEEGEGFVHFGLQEVDGGLVGQADDAVGDSHGEGDGVLLRAGIGNDGVPVGNFVGGAGDAGKDEMSVFSLQGGGELAQGVDEGGGGGRE